MTEDQQRLMSLRLQKIPQAMNGELWKEARKLVEEALAIDPDDAELKAYQVKIANQLNIAETLAQAREAESEEDWRKAVNLCLEAIRLDPNHAEASRSLDHTRRQLKIATLRQQVETLRQQGDKQGELEKLKELQEVVPTDEEVNTQIEELQRTINLETFYAQGKWAYEEKRWEAAINALVYVVEINSFYLDAAPMLLDARDQLTKEQKARHEAKRRQELLKLFDESEELIHSKKWQTAWETLEKIRQDKHYRNVIAKEELFTRLFYVLGRQYAEALEWYPATRCFAQVLEYTPDYRDAKQQLATAQNNNLLRRHYNIKHALGVGGTSQVDYAEDMNRGQCEVSLKYLKASYAIDQEAAISQRFRRQAQRCTTLDHPNIIKILAVEMRVVMEGKQKVDVPVVVMEYIEGQNLAEFLRKTQGVSEGQAIHFTCQLCQALQYAHEHGILHLDIKPSNILIGADGLLKLTDFAHISHGTRGYRSPEQACRSAELDEYTDIFAAGKVLYALLTGKLPAEDPLDEEDSIFQEITPPLQAIIRKAAAPDPTDRYQSAQEMFEALQEAEAALPFWPEFRRRVRNAWQWTVEFAKNWGVLATLIGFILASIVIPILSAEEGTPLASIRDYFYGLPMPIPRSIVVVSPTPTPSPTLTDTPSPTNILASPTPIVTPTATYTPTGTPTSTATSTPADTPRPAQTPVPTTATATDTPRPPTLTPTPTATPQPTGPITLTIYLRHSETDFVELSDDQVDEGIYKEGKCVYGEAAVQIGETTYHFDKPKVGPGEPEQLPDPWRVEFEFAKELKDHTRTEKGNGCTEGTPGFDPKKAQFWVGHLDEHSAVGKDNPYSLTMKLYEGDELQESIQVFFTVKDAPGREGVGGLGVPPTRPPGS
jgi:serine/threonine protein kinase